MVAALVSLLPASLFANTTDYWLNPVSGNWSNATNWSAGVPNNSSNSTYDVFINASGAPYTVSLGPAATATISSLTLGDTQTTFSVGNSTLLTVSGAVDLANSTLELVGTAGIANATIGSSGTGQLLIQSTSIAFNPSFSNVTLATSAIVEPGSTLSIQHNLTLSNGSVHLDGNTANAASVSDLNSSYLVLGTGSFVFDGADNANSIHTLNQFPANLTVRTGTSGGSVFLGNTAFVYGTVSAQTANATLTLYGPASFTTGQGSLIQAINGSALVANNTLATISGTLNVDSSSSIRFTGDYTQTSTAVLTGNGTIYANSMTGTIRIPVQTVHITGTGFNPLSGLTIGGATDHWTGMLDIGQVDLRTQPAIGSADLGTIQNQLHEAYDNGKWDGAGGITSSALTSATGIALMTGADYTAATGHTNFDGQTLLSTDILLHLAPVGDANLDGRVDLSDLSIVLNNFGQSSLSWTHGNFDYTSAIDLSDLSAVLNNFGYITPAGSASQSVVTAVPEPASFALIGFSGTLLWRRRR
jgi:hypothetical protein